MQRKSHLLGSVLVSVFYLVFALGAPARGSKAEGVDLVSIADQVVHAREVAMQEKSNAQDVEHYLSYLTDDAVYEDPVVNARIEGKDTMRKGMSNYLGAYKKTALTVKHRMTAGNVVVLEMNVSFTDTNTGKLVTRDQITLLEFQGTKVRRVMDYWTRS
jgi:ketosteroid isomerase-like protein